MKRFRSALLVLLSVSFLLLVVPAPAQAVVYTVPVYDYVNWILSLVQRYQQIANQVEQLRRQAKQVEVAVKTIERFGKAGDWASLQGLYSNLETLFNATENLGSLSSQLGFLWDDSFPGYYPPVRSWPADQESRARRTFATLRGISLALHQIAALNEQSESALGVLRDRADHADTPQKQLEMHSMFLDLQTTETSRSMQASLLAANAVTVLGAEQLQRASTSDLARTTWIEHDAPRPLSDFEYGTGYTGVPHDWPWTIQF
jgi:P-type conjugative transfer protein TrbJ